MSSGIESDSALTEPVASRGSSKVETACAPEAWVEAYGDFLYSFAMVRLRDPAAAQDVVQETFLAGLRGLGSFRASTEERGWLVGILKHKIRDHFRRTTREPSFTHLSLQHDADSGEFIAGGLRQGAWVADLAPADWPSQPGEGLDQVAFWGVFNQCVAKLPRHAARAFLFREVDELDSKQICEILQITESNLWVLLHRARSGLRRCLEMNWFTKTCR